MLAQAFDFIEDAMNWKKIKILAQHIVDEEIKTIDCNEITALLSKQNLSKQYKISDWFDEEE